MRLTQRPFNKLINQIFSVAHDTQNAIHRTKILWKEIEIGNKHFKIKLIKRMNLIENGTVVHCINVKLRCLLI